MWAAQLSPAGGGSGSPPSQGSSSLSMFVRLQGLRGAWRRLRPSPQENWKLTVVLEIPGGPWRPGVSASLPALPHVTQFSHFWQPQRHMEVPGPGMESESPLQPTPQLQQCHILNPLPWAQIELAMLPRQARTLTHWATGGTPQFFVFGFFFCFFFLVLLGPYLQHMEAPRLGDELELRLPATLELSRV